MDLPLLQAGVDINTIRAWLGHVSLDTTHIYDLAAKAKALARCEVAPALDITPGAKMLACVVPALTIAAHNAEIHRPRTAEGKARSSRNSTVHGLTSKSIGQRRMRATSRATGTPPRGRSHSSLPN